MPRPRRAVQLAPGSLALVLRRRREAGGEPSGARLFRAFRRANALCPGNAGLARAVSRVSLQGWLRGGVLLLQGPAAPLQLLRDAWLRRALRPPQGFLIRAVGDVSPIHMNPISQTQFVPLAEILCCAISDMNAAHVIVTQETLMDQLVKHYPGIATPSQEILYSVLGTLIKERKIYHTGEGYFIVTPHTYFITDNVRKENKKFPLEDNCILLPSTSYLVNMESCGDLSKENIPMVSHYRSCHCFPAQATVCEQRHQQLISHKPNGRGQKGSCELKPIVQNQPESTSVETHSCDTTKSLTSMKENEKCKKFGLSLFWRSTSKKEKPKKKYSSFSAQFPPEEWPVRDEDNLDNIPRDIEHDIIKRINPMLTVDNLVKHTVLMKKIEEQKKYISKGTSTEMLGIKQKHISKGCILKKLNKTAKHHQKVQSNKENQIRKTQRKSQISEIMSENDKQEKCAGCLSSSHVTNEVVAHKQSYKDATVKSHYIYKKQIKNPFQGLPWREKLSTKGHKGQKNSQFKSRIQKQDFNFQRSRSLDSSRIFDHDSICSNAEKCSDNAKQNKLSHISNSFLQPIKSHFNECSNFPERSTLQIDDKCHYSRESSLSDCVYRRAYKKVVDIPKNNVSYVEDMFEFNEEIKCPLSSKDTHQCEKPAIICELLDQTSNQFKNVSLSNDPAADNQIKPSENGANQGQSTDKKNELMFYNTTIWPESINRGNGFTDDQTLYQKLDGYDDVNACSSLYLEEEDYSESYKQQPSHTISETGEWNKVLQQIGTEMFVGNWGLDTHPVECNANINKLDSCGSVDGSQECQKINLPGENCFHDPLSQFVYKHHEKEVDLPKHVQASVTGVSIFDFSKRNEGDSNAETLQNTPNDTREKSACWRLGSQMMEMRGNNGKKQLLFNSTHTTISGPNAQQAPNNLEGTENQSITGDSGIDSPRTQSLASNNSAILDGLKRRQSFLQNFEGINNSTESLSQNTLSQLTPVMNV